MTTRLTTRTVKFSYPFTLNNEDGERPPGAYVVEIEEKEVRFVFFSIFRHQRTVMHRDDLHAGGGLIRFFSVDPSELKAALAREQQISAQFE